MDLESISTIAGLPVNTVPTIATLAATAFLIVRESKKSTANEKQKAELAISAAYNKTHAYYAYRNDGGEKDHFKEHEVAKAWNEAAILLRIFDFNLHHRLKLKSRFWHEGAAWSEEQIKLANIGLEDVRREGTIVLRT